MARQLVAGHLKSKFEEKEKSYQIDCPLIIRFSGIRKINIETNNIYFMEETKFKCCIDWLRASSNRLKKMFNNSFKMGVRII